jgi:cyclophilin family peptidyl-prolyl cis-trans isomerase
MSLFGKGHKQWSQAPAMQIDGSKNYHAVLDTSKGEIEVELFATEAPKTVNNFVFLAREGFYDGVPFHRVISGFMVQTGDPTGTGTGGPGYRFADEKVDRSYDRGTLAMANAGPNTNGSQFFLMHQSRPLPPNYTIFGRVTRGLDVLDAIASVPVGASRGGEQSSPREEVKINSVRVQEV